MLGAIFGDIVGSQHEFAGTKTKNFPFPGERSFATDDSYLTIAVAACVLDGPQESEYVRRFHEMVHRFPGASWGLRFARWAREGDTQPYNSWGNGSAMRVSPIGFAYNTRESVLAEAKRSAEVSHNHPEGIKGAQTTALAILLACQGASKSEIRDQVAAFSEYDLSQSIDTIRPDYTFNESCQGTVPQAIIAFLDSTDFVDAIKNAVSLGGDADTLAAITGGIAQAHYGFPSYYRDFVQQKLPPDLWNVVIQFESKFGMN